MELPCDECKGQCCTFPPMSLREFKSIRKKYGIPKNAIVIKNENIVNHNYKHRYLMMALKPDNKTCAFLVDGKCSVYDLRPKTCREYGVNPKMPCMYLYPEKAREEMQKLENRARGMVTD